MVDFVSLVSTCFLIFYWPNYLLNGPPLYSKLCFSYVYIPKSSDPDYTETKVCHCFGNLYLRSLTLVNSSMLGVYCPDVSFMHIVPPLCLNDKLVNTDKSSNVCSNYLNALVNLIRRLMTKITACHVCTFCTNKDGVKL